MGGTCSSISFVESNKVVVDHEHKISLDIVEVDIGVYPALC